MNKGKNFRVLSTDHKPNEEHESQRILANGGKIYQTKTPTKLFTGEGDENAVPQILLGPYRVFPGRLSVSRTIGDIEAKEPQFGGIPGVVIAEPEITYFTIDDNIDFLMLGCDGIFDQLSNEEIIDSALISKLLVLKRFSFLITSGPGLNGSLLELPLDYLRMFLHLVHLW